MQSFVHVLAVRTSLGTGVRRQPLERNRLPAVDAGAELATSYSRAGRCYVVQLHPIVLEHCIGLTLIDLVIGDIGLISGLSLVQRRQRRGACSHRGTHTGLFLIKFPSQDGKLRRG